MPSDQQGNTQEVPLRHRPRADGHWWASNSRCYTLAHCASCHEPIARLEPRLRNSAQPSAKAWHFQCALDVHPVGVPRTINGIASLSPQDQAYIASGLEAARQTELHRPEGVAQVLPELPTVQAAQGSLDSEGEMDWWDGIGWEQLRTHADTLNYVPTAVQNEARLFMQDMLHTARTETGVRRERALKCFLGVPRLLFSGHGDRGGRRGNTQKAREVAERIAMCRQGRWEAAWLRTQDSRKRKGQRTRQGDPDKRVIEEIERLMFAEELGKAARQVQDDIKIAPGVKAAPLLPNFFRTVPLPDPLAMTGVQSDTASETQDLEVFAAQLEDSISRSPARSAAGVDGYRYEHLRLLLKIPTALQDLAWVLRGALQGLLGDGPLHALATTRIIALDKGPTIRPIQITSVLKRAANRAVARMELQSVMDTLASGQHGLAVTAGAELMHKSVAMLLQRFDDFAMVIADAEDAFGNADRAKVQQEVASDHPSMLPWISPSLGIAHRAVWRDDMGVEHIYRCSRGLLQGDPLSAMLFCKLQDGVLRTLEGELRVMDPRAQVLAYLDDVVILCSSAQLPGAYLRYKELMGRCGIPIQETKSEYWARARIDGLAVPFTSRPRVMKQQALPIAAVPDSPLAAGSWLNEGSPEVDDLRQKRRAAIGKIVALGKKGLPKQQALALIRAITVSDAVWIMRSSGIPESVAAQMDRDIVTSLGEIIDLTGISPEHLDTIWWPLREGGLGFQSITHVAKLANAASWMQCLGVLRERLMEDDVGLLESHVPDLATALAAVRALAQELECEHLVGEVPHGGKNRLTQKALVTRRTKQIIDEWHARPSISPAAKAWVRSCGGKGGAFLLYPKCAAHKMEDQEFERSVQLRLYGDVVSGGELCPFRSAARAGTAAEASISPANLACTCRMDAKAVHTLSCPRAGGLVRRHNAVTRTALRTGFQALGCEAILSEQLTSPDASGVAPRCDLAAVAEDGRQVLVDVVIAHPCSVEAMSAHSWKTNGTAARLAEHDKATTYGARNVVAAAVETGGRVGRDFEKLVSTLLPEDLAARSRAATDFWQRFSVVLQRENARTIQLARRGDAR